MKTFIERQRYFIDFTLSSLFRRKVKNTALVLCYAFIIFLLATVLFFAGSLRKEAETLLEGSPEILVQRIIGGRHALIPESYGDEIGKIRGVRRVKSRLWGYYFHIAAGANYTVMVSDSDDIGDDAAKIGDGVNRTWKLKEGEPLFFKAFDGEVVRLAVQDRFSAETDLMTADLIIVSENTFRRIFGYPEKMATDLGLSVRNPKEWQTVVEKIYQLLPDTRTITREEIQRTYSSLFDWRSGYILLLLVGAIFAFLIFAVDKATGLSAEERHEIAVLKAVGWETSDVLLIKFWEGLIISLSAYLLGIIAAYVHVFLYPAPLFEHALKGWSVLYPRFQPAPQFNVYDLAVVFAFTVVPYSFITIVPAWKASITDPDTVMRSG